MKYTDMQLVEKMLEYSEKLLKYLQDDRIDKKRLMEIDMMTRKARY